MSSLDTSKPRYEVVLTTGYWSYQIVDIQGDQGIVGMFRNKERATDYAYSVNSSHSLSCCVQSSSSNGWRHNGDCKNWTSCY
jgi:hypothetical protein